MKKIDIEQLFKDKGFSLNVYGLDILWEFTVKDDDILKESLCQIFGIDIQEPETIILQCRENFTNCIFYYDCNVINLNTEDFIECVKQMDNVRAA